MGDIRLSSIKDIFYEALSQTVTIMYIIVTAAMFGWLLVYMRGPYQLAKLITSFTNDPNVFFVLTIILLLILGCFMESIAIMLTIVPILYPIALKMGINLVHFGVVFTLALMVGLITPPLGMSLFAVSAITDLAPEEFIKECVPYLIALLALTFILAFFPAETLAIPNYFMKG